MSKVIELNDGNFKEEVTDYAGVVLVDFAAEWCGPCQRLSPIIQSLAEDFDGKVKVGHLDIDHARETTTSFGVMSVPTVIVVKGGKEVTRSVGLVPKQSLATLLNSALA